MQVMMMILGDEAAWAAMPAPAQAEVMGAYRAYVEALAAAGVMRGGERLRPATEAMTLRVREGRMTVLDGPYAETKEQLGGFFLLEVPDMDAAAQWAARCPGAAHGTIELRPVWVAEP
jgi:hypothetical protein